MSEKKSKEKLLEDLIQMQKNIEKKVKIQDSLIKSMQLLIQNEGLHFQVIGNFPYPIAIFERNGILIMANHILLQRANIKPDDVQAGKINFLSRITNENSAVLEAVEDIFLGETTLLKNLVEPLSMFVRDDFVPDYSDGYESAVFFPVVESNDHISHGAVMLMK
ncbi:hypothetical protein [Dehalobacter sp. TBBPA1]|uniref:hypothetical protein n=1 Tax=Dehalobacter sp. TBBPA1 TaxID=3235037 RepID=UPI0034A1D0E0